MVILDTVLTKMNKKEALGHMIGKDTIQLEGGEYGN